mgnify:CR=1 FL=1
MIAWAIPTQWDENNHYSYLVDNILCESLLVVLSHIKGKQLHPQTQGLQK